MYHLFRVHQFELRLFPLQRPRHKRPANKSSRPDPNSKAQCHNDSSARNAPHIRTSLSGPSDPGSFVLEQPLAGYHAPVAGQCAGQTAIIRVARMNGAPHSPGLTSNEPERKVPAPFFKCRSPPIRSHPLPLPTTTGPEHLRQNPWELAPRTKRNAPASQSGGRHRRTACLRRQGCLASA